MQKETVYSQRDVSDWNLIYNDKAELIAIRQNGFIGLIGFHTSETIASLMIALGIKIHKFTLIFPGNNDHHTPGTTLYNHKSGGGLARLAHDIYSNLGGSTLSLPTRLDGDDAENIVVIQSGLEDLWRAVGYEQIILLPIRIQTNNTYFGQPLFEVEGISYEPSFWGGIVAASNLQLGNHYVNHLRLVLAVLSGKNRDTALDDLAELDRPCFDSYGKGRRGVKGKEEDVEDGWYNIDNPVIVDESQFLGRIQNRGDNRFLANFSGYTSNHAERTMSVDFINAASRRRKSELKAKVLTWNLQAKCTAVINADNSVTSNNPLNCEESEDEYEFRKEIEFAYLANLIKESKDAKEPLDFILLQDVDFVPKARTEADKTALNNPVYDKFLERFNDDYRIVYSSPLRVAILIKKDRWIFERFQKNPDHYVFLKPKTPYGFQVMLTEIGSKTRCIVSNLLLDNNADYRDAIEHYRLENSRKGIYTIMGGSVRSIEHKQIRSLIADQTHPTHIVGSLDSKGQLMLTDKQLEGTQELPRVSDGFLVEPIPGILAEIEEGGAYFELKPNQRVVVRRVHQQKDHRMDISREVVKKKEDPSLPSTEMSNTHSDSTEEDRFSSDDDSRETLEQQIANAKTIQKLGQVMKANSDYSTLQPTQIQNINAAKLKAVESIFVKERTAYNQILNRAKEWAKWGWVMLVPLIVALVFLIKYFVARSKATVIAYDLIPPNENTYNWVSAKFDKAPVHDKTKENKLRKTVAVNREDPQFMLMKSSVFKTTDERRVRVYLTKENKVKKFLADEDVAKLHPVRVR